MARDHNGKLQSEDYVRPVRRLLLGGIMVIMIALFLLWRIDNPRMERFRTAVIDAVVPHLQWVSRPLTTTANILQDFQSYHRIYEQNRELRMELQQMRAWREAALQLEQENAKLLDLNNVRIDPSLTFITGEVLADSGSPFRQSVLLNVGQRDAILDGWPVMDGIGLVGRISGVGHHTSRVLMLTDTSSRIPVTIQPSGLRGILVGDNTIYPLIEFVETAEQVRPGDRVVTSGDGGIFPADLLVGQVALGADRRLRLRLAADYERLEYLRVLRAPQIEILQDTGGLIATPGLIGPIQPEEALPEESANE